jgi:uncharacterized protein with von Willebrand factor type A (vWA) domain
MPDEARQMADQQTFLDSVIGFAGVLRRSGVPVSVGEVLDAAQALSHVDLMDRQAVRTSLCATMVKRPEHLSVFDDSFATWFRAGQHQFEWSLAPRFVGADDLLEALQRCDMAALRAAAAAAVSESGGLNGERLSSERHHLFRVLRRLDLTRVLQQAMADDRAAGADLARVAVLRERTAEFRRMVAEEVRARLVGRTGDNSLPGLGQDVDEVDFLRASPAQLKAMQDAVRPLARRLATRLARRRQLQQTGRIDVRRTARRSLSTGGVPIDLAFRRPRVHHPDLFVLCDVSGSVADFARFTITLLHALYRELPKTRLFAFVDGIDEVTELIDRLPARLDVAHLLAATDAVGPDGHSDYGAALERFWVHYGGNIGGTSTIIIAGDGRTNYRQAGTARLAALHQRARRLYWLNPEARVEWGTTDSYIEEYRRHCDGMFEVRNLRQLGEFVYQLT